jgi:hypothetical protein
LLRAPHPNGIAIALRSPREAGHQPFFTQFADASQVASPKPLTRLKMRRPQNLRR